jgi:hypothetical protein
MTTKKKKALSAYPMREDRSYVTLHLCAPNDTNGNPRRCWLLLEVQKSDTEGVPDWLRHVAVCDEGYGNLPNEWPTPTSIAVPPAERREWLRLARDPDSELVEVLAR